MKRCLLLLLLLSLLALPAGLRAQAPKALFDYTLNETAGNADWIIDTQQPIPSPLQSGITSSTTESYWLGAISAWGVDLVKMGFIVHTLTTTYGITYGNANNPYDLSNYNLFIVCEPQNQLTAAEKTAILSFVQNGGGLMMVADHYASDRDNDGWDSAEIWNDLGTSTYFGIHFQAASESNNNIVQNCTNLATSASDSIIRGPAGTVTSLYYHNGTTMNMLTANNPSAAGHIWMNSIARGTTQVVAATASYGRGRVAAIGDSSPADDGTGQSGNTLYVGWDDPTATNDRVILNMCSWLVASPPASVPAQVTLASPANAAVGVASPSTFRWNKPAGATGYQIDISTSNTFSSFFLLDSSLVDTSRSVGGFALNTTYYWRVRAKNASGWGAYSASRSFTSWNVPAAPALLSPANLAAGVASPSLFRWNASAAATSYEIDVSVSNTFSPLFLLDSSLVDTSRSAGGFALSTVYYWRVRAKNAAGWGSYSATRSFTSWDVPPAVALAQPPDAATGVVNPVSFSWHAALTASAYQIDVATSDTFALVAATDSAVTDTATVIGGLAAGTTYYWRVRAKSGAGWGAYGPVRSFAMLDLPPAVPLISPAQSAQDVPVPVSLAWSAVPGADRYHVYCFDFFGVDYFTYLNDSTTTDTTASIADVSQLQRMFFTVRAHNAAGWGPFAPTREFMTWSAPQAAILIAPSDSATEVPIPVEFRWRAAEKAAAYVLEVSTDAPSSAVVFMDSSITDTSAAVSSLLPGTAYRWSVRGRNLAGWGQAQERHLTTWQLPGQVSPASPPDGASGLTLPVALRWGSVEGSTSYEVQIATDGGFVQMVADDSTLADTVYALSTADSLQIYHWRVRARGIAGWGAYSAARTFTLSQLQTVVAQFNGRWNLVSLPLVVADRSVASLFPLASSPAYAFENGYHQADSLEYGAGYWIKLPAAAADSLTGVRRLSDTVIVRQGWNIVGSLSVPVPAAAVTTMPAGIIVSNFYGYDGAYVTASTLLPFRGYWVKCSQDGVIILP